MSSSVCEQHDSPSLGGELGPAVLAAPHLQLMRFSDSTLASLVELPALDMPAATTPGNYLMYDQYESCIVTTNLSFFSVHYRLTKATT